MYGSLMIPEKLVEETLLSLKFISLRLFFHIFSFPFSSFIFYLFFAYTGHPSRYMSCFIKLFDDGLQSEFIRTFLKHLYLLLNNLKVTLITTAGITACTCNYIIYSNWTFFFKKMTF